MIKLLLVEDDANLCYIIRGGLEDMIGGYEVTTALTSISALHRLKLLRMGRRG